MSISRLGVSNKWVEIASSSPTSGTTVSFTSIAEYKDLAIFAYGINAGGSVTNLKVRLNNDSGNNYSRSLVYWDSSNSRVTLGTDVTISDIFGTVFNVRPTGFQTVIEGANSPFKQITSRIFEGQSYESFATWQSTDVINRIDVISSATYSAGTIKIFGRN